MNFTKPCRAMYLLSSLNIKCSYWAYPGVYGYILPRNNIQEWIK